MGILGLTHDEKGLALEKLPVAIKVAIGEGPDPDAEDGEPHALFHFVFKRKVMRGQSVYWESAPDIAEVYGEKPTKLGVIFLHDDPREVFPSEYALWTWRGRFCHGELVQIVNGVGRITKCRQFEGRGSTRRGSPGRAAANTWMDRRKASRLKVVAPVAQNLKVAIVGLRGTCISSWRNSPAWELSVDCTRGARPRFPTSRMR